MLKDCVLQVLKATCAAIVFSLVFVLVFTLVIQVASLTSEVIKPVNQVFKILAIAGGGLLFIRGDKGLLKGAVYGVCAVLLTYLLFSIMSGSFSVSWLFALELFLGAAAGAISGVIAVNIKRA